MGPSTKIGTPRNLSHAHYFLLSFTAARCGVVQGDARIILVLGPEGVHVRRTRTTRMCLFLHCYRLFVSCLLQLRDEELSKEMQESNWFSAPSALRVYDGQGPLECAYSRIIIDCLFPLRYSCEMRNCPKGDAGIQLVLRPEGVRWTRTTIVCLFPHYY